MGSFVFKRVLADKVMATENPKDMTRRRFYDTDIITTNAAGEIVKVQRLNKRGRLYTLYEVGKVCPVQIDYRSKSPCGLRIDRLRFEAWGDITEADAKREGFTSVAEFLAYVATLYPTSFDITAPCWVIEFTRVDKATP